LLRKGYSPDNAACEAFFGRPKTELFYPRNWQSASIEQLGHAADAHIRWHSENWISISLGSERPLEYRWTLGISGWPVRELGRAPGASGWRGTQQSGTTPGLPRRLL